VLHQTVDNLLDQHFLLRQFTQCFNVSLNLFQVPVYQLIPPNTTLVCVVCVWDVGCGGDVGYVCACGGCVVCSVVYGVCGMCGVYV